MKIILVYILFLGISVSLFGQNEIELNGLYGIGTYSKFKNNYGFGVGFNRYINPNQRIGFAFTYAINNKGHDYYNGEDGISYQNVKSQNTKLSIKFNYSWNLLDNSKSCLFIGPEIGLSYFHIKEHYDRVYKIGGETLIEQGSTDNWDKNRFVSGFMIEYELREIIMKSVSLSFSIHPDLTLLYLPGVKGIDESPLSPSLNFNVGIKYMIK